jgi:spore coat polysaccharide biosynthesis protein SpsF
MSSRNEVEGFWKGEFGDDYLDRSQEHRLLPGKSYMFEKMLGSIDGLQSIIELGTNQGVNLKILHNMFPGSELVGVEINTRAAEIARGREGVTKIIESSLLDLDVSHKFDLSFTAGVLIHIHPENIYEAYEKLHSLSKRYVLMCEYYNPTPVMVEYRGHEDRLFKRDFPGEFLTRYEDFALRDYGFFYHLDQSYNLGDLHWFLMEKMD